MRFRFLALLMVAACHIAAAQTRPLHPEGGPISPAVTNAPLKKLTATTYEIGAVRLDKEKRTVTFPASVNLVDGLLEYLIVCTDGKIHESALITETEPYHIHLAMLFLGAKGASPLTAEERVKEEVIKGQPFNIWVEWKAGETTKRVRGESLVRNAEAKESMVEGPWTYNGSWIFQGAFLAQRERSIVAIITDHDALANNPRPGRENDEIWLADKDAMPQLGTKVTVTFDLELEATQP